MRTALKAGLALAVASFALAGCTPEVPALPTVTPPVESAALIPGQAEPIMAETFLQILAADQARDASLLSNRVAPDIGTLRAAQYTVADATDDYQLPALPGDIQVYYTSATAEWPRLLVGVSKQPAESVTPVVYVWVQDSVGADYELRHFAHMIPGAVLPAMPGASVGADRADLDDAEGLATTPRAAMSDYVNLLRAGTTEEPGDAFESDSYREQLFATRQTLTTAAEDVKGTYLDTVSWDTESTFVLRTADGGVLVFARITMDSTFAVPNSTLSVPAGDAALLGDAKLGDTVTHEYWDYIVLHVPASGGTAKPSVVAGEHGLVAVTNGEAPEEPSPSPSPEDDA